MWKDTVLFLGSLQGLGSLWKCTQVKRSSPKCCLIHGSPVRNANQTLEWSLLIREKDD